MKLISPFIATVIIVSVCCKNAPKQAETQGPESVAGISLAVEYLGTDSLEIPHSVLILVENGGAVVLDTLSLSLAKIEKTSYAEMDIPADAIDAYGGWFAGGGDYFYVIKRNDNAVVFRGFQEEQQSDKGYHWREFDIK